MLVRAKIKRKVGQYILVLPAASKPSMRILSSNKC